MEMEIEELKRQRDRAQSQVDELRRKVEDEAKVIFSSIPPSLYYNHVKREETKTI